jgi:hypothetical protein
MKSTMRSLFYLLVFFTAAAYAQQTSPYAEFYGLIGDSTRIQEKFRITNGGIKAKVFSTAGKQLNAKIIEGEVSLVQKSVVERTFKIKDSNEINFNEILAYSRPGDRIIIKIKSVMDLDRKKPVYLGKADFSFTLE